MSNQSSAPTVPNGQADVHAAPEFTIPPGRHRRPSGSDKHTYIASFSPAPLAQIHNRQHFHLDWADKLTRGNPHE
jgi:hypothetical protein